MRREMADSRKLTKSGESITVTLPKNELRTFGILEDDELLVDEATPYLDLERGAIGLEVELPE